MSASRIPTESDMAFMLGQIQAGQTLIQQTLSEDRLASAQYRTEVRKELKDHGERMQKIETQVADMQPKVNSLNDRALMSKGAANLAIVLGKGAHVISAGLGAVIVFVLERFFFGKP